MGRVRYLVALDPNRPKLPSSVTAWRKPSILRRCCDGRCSATGGTPCSLTFGTERQRRAAQPSRSALVNVRSTDGFSSVGRSRYLISPRMVSASQLCSAEKLAIGKGCVGPGTNFWTNSF